MTVAPKVETAAMTEGAEKPFEDFGAELDAANFYFKRTHAIDPQRVERVVTLLEDFSGSRMNSAAKSAVFLRDICAGVDDSLLARNASWALNTYRTNSFDTEETQTYKLAIARDIQRIDDFSREMFEQETRTGSVAGMVFSGITRVLSKKERLAYQDQRWLRDSNANAGELQELLDTNKRAVNLEAMVHYSAEVLDDLMAATGAVDGVRVPDDEVLMRRIRDVDVVLGPFLEIIGHDGMAMALRSHANIVRLQKTGNVAFVDRAKNMLEQYTDREYIAGQIEKLYGELFGGDSVVEHVISNKTQHGIAVGESAFRWSECYANARAVWRVKSVGSLAMKLYRYSKEGKSTATPQDIIGVTLITDDPEQLNSLYPMLVLSVESSRAIKTTVAPSKKSAYHVRGDGLYVESISKAVCQQFTEDARTLLGLGPVEIDTKDDENNLHQTAKATFTFHALPFEVQCQTEWARERSRIGAGAHGFHKSGVRELNQHFIAQLHSRRAELGTMELTKASADGTRRFMSSVARRGIPPVNYGIV